MSRIRIHDCFNIYPGLLCNEHPAFIKRRHYRNSTEAVYSISEADNEDLLSFKLVEKGVFHDGHPGCTQLLHQGGSSMEQRTPLCGADEKDLRPQLFDYQGLLCNGHPASVEVRHYRNSTEEVNSIIVADDEDLSSFKSVDIVVFRDGPPG